MIRLLPTVMYPSLAVSIVTQPFWAQPMAVVPQRVRGSPGLAIGNRVPWRTPHSALMRTSSIALGMVR